MDLRLLAKRNFATAVTFSFILGMVLNGSTILLPQFLQNDLGYTAQQAGMALLPGGIALALMMPIAGILASKFDPRFIIAIGFALLSFGLFHVTEIYLGVSFSTDGDPIASSRSSAFRSSSSLSVRSTMWGCRRTNSTRFPASAISRAIWAAASASPC